MNTASSDPHAPQPVLAAGPAPKDAPATLVLVHGRGGSAEDMLSLCPELGVDALAAVAPQAAGHTWYPNSFLSPLASNQPYLDSALRKLSSVVDDLIGRGISPERIALLGFSQGACLTSEFVARNPRRYGAVMVLTGGLIGPPGTPRDYPGSLDATPVFLGCGDPDPHIPFGRVLETESVFQRMGAATEVRRYPGRPHTISRDELDACRALLHPLVS
jgi:predicted esterase